MINHHHEVRAVRVEFREQDRGQGKMTTRDDIASIGFGTQIRKSPYFDATVRWGAKQFSVYNHMYIPRDFGDPIQNFWNLVNSATLSDVGVERQVEITGPDAKTFIQKLTPRNLSDCKVGQCKYVLITNSNGGILNDPVLLRLAENHFWLSLADSDILLWAQGVAVNSGLDVEICEPDVSPLQIQGPRSRQIMIELFGDAVKDLRYYRLREYNLNQIPLIVSRTGWSSELGYELFLRDGTKGDELWERIMKAGEGYGLKAGHTSAIRRIEAGMLSYHADMDSSYNPFELGLEHLVDLDMEADFIGKDALKEIASSGVSRKLVGIEISGDPLTSANNEFWPVIISSSKVGHISSAIFSPRLGKNIALAMMDIKHSSLNTSVEIIIREGGRLGRVVAKPFFDPNKKIVAS